MNEKKFKIINKDTKTEIQGSTEDYFLDLEGNVYKAKFEGKEFDLIMQIHLAYEEVK